MHDKSVLLYLCVLESQGTSPNKESNELNRVDGSSLDLNSLSMQVEVDHELRTSLDNDTIPCSMANTKQTARKENLHQGTPA